MPVEAREAPFMLGDWQVEPKSCRLMGAEEIVKIDPQHMRLLMFFAAHPDEVLSQQQIESAVWGDVIVTPSSVYQGVAQLRRALREQKGAPRYIETIPRRGYRLIAPVLEDAVRNAATPAPDETAVPIHRSAPAGSRMKWGVVAGFLLGAASVGTLFHERLERFTAPDTGAASTTSTNVGTGSDSYERLLLASKSEEIVDPASRAYLLLNLSGQEMLRGRPAMAMKHAEEGFELQREISGHHHPNVVAYLTMISNIHLWEGEIDKAEVTARQALEILDRSALPLHPERGRAHTVLADALIDSERFDEAAVQLELALQHALKVYGASHVRTFEAKHSLAQVRLGQGRLDEAERLARQTFEDYARLTGKGGPTHGYRTLLAEILLKQRRYAHSAALAREAIELLRVEGQQRHPYVATAQNILGESLIQLEQYAEAEQELRAEVELLLDIHAEDWRVARAKSALGEALLRQGQLSEASTYIKVAHDELQKSHGWLPRQALEQTLRRLQQVATLESSSQQAMATART